MIRLGNVKFRASSNFPIALDFQYILNNISSRQLMGM